MILHGVFQRQWTAQSGLARPEGGYIKAAQMVSHRFGQYPLHFSMRTWIRYWWEKTEQSGGAGEVRSCAGETTSSTPIRTNHGCNPAERLLFTKKLRGQCGEAHPRA